MILEEWSSDRLILALNFTNTLQVSYGQANDLLTIGFKAPDLFVDSQTFEPVV